MATNKPRWYLQILYTTWVFWGYGKRKSVMHMDPARLDLGQGLSFPFKLPAQSSGLAKPVEYERRATYGWRWNHQNGAGHSWREASSVEDAVAQARDNIEHMRIDTQPKFVKALGDVRVTR